MKYQFVQKKNYPHLFLWFAGWGMDDRPFRKYCPSHADFLVCYDYRSLAFDHSLLDPYTSVTVAGWSMGVWAASQVFAAGDYRIGERIAVNGTNYPVDEQRGISPVIFNGTLDGLENQQTYQKFLLRMCGSKVALAGFMQMSPSRTLQELKEELASIGKDALRLSPSSFVWERAFIGSQDRIFVPECQLQAFGASTQIEVRHVPHYSETLFREIIENSISNK